ncbi:MAG: hypothetical protein JRJ12_07635 [Deltaproteobacteria bacterium]|nr:hypothetical protein [Deltaproteobacteria bacterium]MBW2071379.1 hypothetical protein [Deltaproteobacteria bacterium]
MKRVLFCLVVVIAVAAMVAPSFAAEAKFGGVFRVRAISNDNISSGDDDVDDNNNFVDQRLRWYFFAVASENLRFVWRAEIGDITWGQPGSGKGQGGAKGADAVNVETKNAYMDFTIPGYPIRTQLGIQGVALHKGWYLDDDFSAAKVALNFDPVDVIGYFAWHTNDDNTKTSDDIWNTGASVGYKAETWNARLSFGAQHSGREAAQGFVDDLKNGLTGLPGLSPGDIAEINAIEADDDGVDLFILMGEFNMKWENLSAFLIAGKNFGSLDLDGASDQDFKGWMVDVGANYLLDPFTLSAEFLYLSGDDDITDGDLDDFDNWVPFSGASHYWSEILGLGTLDRNGTAGGDFAPFGNFTTGVGNDHPSNALAFKLGASMMATESTKLTLNYWFNMHAEDVFDDANDLDSTDDAIGHEFDFYLDQGIWEGLKLRLVGAYLFADDGFSTSKSDDDVYELGARVQYNW